MANRSLLGLVMPRSVCILLECFLVLVLKVFLRNDGISQQPKFISNCIRSGDLVQQPTILLRQSLKV